MKITKKQVEDVAQLARLTLSEEDLEKMTFQLDNILSYVEKLNELDTSSIQPTTHVFSICNAFREDMVQPSLSLEEAMINAPKRQGNMFQVPRIIL